MFNRHGLIAGATGTGKTKTLQVITEQLSQTGVPVMVMDIKGDLSGIAMPGTPHPKIEERHRLLGLPWQPRAVPVEFASLSDEPGARLRATVSEFGPVLFSKMLGLNDTQAGVMAVAFKYCDDHRLPLLDLNDIRTVLNHISSEGKAEVENRYGRLSTATVGTIVRKLLELEQQGASRFFGELSFQVEDLCRRDAAGRGIVTILRLTDLQDRPKLFSTFMLALLSEMYGTFPELGDPDRPRLVLFIDEAHLIFDEASKALLDQIETVIKLIRSKAVGVFFCTQSPQDVPAAVLGQLGLKIQHALRAFTAKDRKAIKLAAENYPDSPFYDLADLLTQMGIGEAMVTGLNPKGVPTPTAHVLLRSPESRMGVLEMAELQRFCATSPLVHKYSQAVDPESAYELITRKLQAAASERKWSEIIKERAQTEPPPYQPPRSTRSASRPPPLLAPSPPQKSILEQVIGSSTARQVGNTVAREITRGLLGALGFGNTRRRRR
jgi:hypothetical protein